MVNKPKTLLTLTQTLKEMLACKHQAFMMLVSKPQTRKRYLSEHAQNSDDDDDDDDDAQAQNPDVGEQTQTLMLVSRPQTLMMMLAGKPETSKSPKP